MQIAADKDIGDRFNLSSQQEAIAKPLTIVNSKPENIRSISKERSESSNLESKFFLAQYWQIDNFLPQKEYQKVLNIALSKQVEFKDS